MSARNFSGDNCGEAVVAVSVVSVVAVVVVAVVAEAVVASVSVLVSLENFMDTIWLKDLSSDFLSKCSAEKYVRIVNNFTL